MKLNDFLFAFMQDHLISTLNPQAGMSFIDVAGGTGDVAFRVLEAVRQSVVDLEITAYPLSKGMRIVMVDGN